MNFRFFFSFFFISSLVQCIGYTDFYWHHFSFDEIDLYFGGTSFQFLIGQPFTKCWTKSFHCLRMPFLIEFLDKKNEMKKFNLNSNEFCQFLDREKKTYPVEDNSWHIRQWIACGFCFSFGSQLQFSAQFTINACCHFIPVCTSLFNALGKYTHTNSEKKIKTHSRTTNIFFENIFQFTSRPVGSESFRIWHTTKVFWASGLLFKQFNAHEWMRLPTHSFSPWWHSKFLPSASRLFDLPNGTKFTEM